MAAHKWPPQPPALLRLLSIDDVPDALGGGLRLSEFFETWFLRHVLDRDGRDPKTAGSYRESLKWWRALTDDPPVDAIDSETITRFAAGLLKATWRRGCGESRPLSACSINKHKKQIRAILYRLGPDVDPRRECTGILAKAPHIAVRQPKLKPKAAWELDEVKRIVAAARRMPGTDALSQEHSRRFGTRSP